MRKRRLPIDTRLNWRDPDMPVLRLNDKRQMIEVQPKWIEDFYKSKLNDPYYGAPHYKHDPSYWWSNKKLK